MNRKFPIVVTKHTNNKELKYNKFILLKDYGIGYCINDNSEFYFDLEDFEKIKVHRWSNHKGYIRSIINNKDILLHRFVMNAKNGQIVDHIKHHTYDNRKSQLRITDNYGNHRNKALSKNNKSGIIGVCKEKDKWHAYIWVNGKCKHLGRFYNKKEAIAARKEAENVYFGNFSYNNSMNDVKVKVSEEDKMLFEEKYKQKNRQRSVLQYDKNNNLIKTWNNMSSASNYLNCSIGDIWRCCNNKRKTCKGYIWKYDEK